MLRHAFKDLPDFGVKIRHKLDGNLFNTRRLKKRSTQIATIEELLYADNVSCVDHNATDLQTATTSLNEACLSWGLTISKPKTEVLHANCPDPAVIKIDEHQLKHVHKFTYLGGVMTDDASLDAEINRGISRAAGIYRSLSVRCWNRSSLSTKLTVYKAAVLPPYTPYTPVWQ